jgi:hypothetical protein
MATRNDDIYINIYCSLSFPHVASVRATKAAHTQLKIKHCGSPPYPASCGRAIANVHKCTVNEGNRRVRCQMSPNLLSKLPWAPKNPSAVVRKYKLSELLGVGGEGWGGGVKNPNEMTLYVIDAPFFLLLYIIFSLTIEYQADVS